jgi:voltage-gated potassium channel Kch
MQSALIARWLGWFRNEDTALSVFLALLILSTVLSWPLRSILPAWAFDFLFAATILFGVLVLAPSPKLAVGAALVGLAVTLQRLTWSGRLTVLEAAAPMAFFLMVAAALFVRVFRPGRITVHRLLGAVALFIVLGVVWGLAYQAIEVARPGALRMNGAPASPQDAMWLSFVTLTTVGYGDVVPVLPIARSLAAMEALTGVLYPSVLIGFLLSDVAKSRQ